MSPSRQSDYRKAYYAANQEKARQASREYYAANREAILERQRAKRQAGNDLEKKASAEWRLYGKHRLTVERRQELLESQEYVCPGCATDLRTLEPRERSVDHDHRCCPSARSCGRCVRGLLCKKCNLALGLANDSPKILRQLAAYLERTSD